MVLPKVKVPFKLLAFLEYVVQRRTHRQSGVEKLPCIPRDNRNGAVCPGYNQVFVRLDFIGIVGTDSIFDLDVGENQSIWKIENLH